MKSALLRDIFLYRIHSRVFILLSSFIACILGLMGPIFQKEFIDILTHTPALHLLWSASLFSDLSASPLLLIFVSFLCVLCSQIFSQLTNYLGYRESIILQRNLAERVYKKMLHLRVDSPGKKSLGEIVALYATDIPGSTIFLEQTLPTGAGTFFPFLLAPLAVSVVLQIDLWPIFLAMMAIGSLNFLLAFRQSKFFYLFKQLAAERIGLVNEWIQSIRTLRILGWTNYFEDKILAVREIETENRVRMVTNGQTMNAISSCISFILNLFALSLLLLWRQQTPTSGEMLALLWILGIFLTRPFRQMPWFFTFAFDSWTSLKRVQSFLEVPDFPVESARNLNADTTKEPALSVKDLNLSISGKKILSDITFQVEEGELIALVGEVGSGKSMLLLSIIGETGATFGSLRAKGKDSQLQSVKEWRSHFAFVPQEAFIMSASLRENVAFDYDLDKNLDEQIEMALQLSQFSLNEEHLSDGLNTEVGERGVNLSGGQKQRVNLARAQNYPAPILLLDDCLSAVDVRTEENIVTKLLKGVWSNRVRILITHRLSVLPKVDRIFFMHEGRIVEQGSYTELLSSSREFQSFTKSLGGQKSIDEKSESEAHGPS